MNILVANSGRRHRGSALLLGLVLLTGLAIMSAAFLTRVDAQTKRVMVLKRGVQALFMANEALDSLKRELQTNGQPQSKLELQRVYGQASAFARPTSAANRSWVAFARGTCEGVSVTALATLRRDGRPPYRARIENKMVFYGAHEIDRNAVQQVLLGKLEGEYRELRRTLDADRELDRQHRLGETYRGFLSESGLPEDVTTSVVKVLED